MTVQAVDYADREQDILRLLFAEGKAGNASRLVSKAYAQLEADLRTAFPDQKEHIAVFIGAAERRMPAVVEAFGAAQRGEEFTIPSGTGSITVALFPRSKGVD